LWLAIIIRFALNVVYQTMFNLGLDAKERELRDPPTAHLQAKFLRLKLASKNSVT
jgi:hypothetical protein